MVSIKDIIPAGSLARIELVGGGAIEGVVESFGPTYVVLTVEFAGGRHGVRFSEIVRAFPLGTLVPKVVA